MNDAVQQRTYLSVAEATAELDALGDADWLQLGKLASLRAPVGMAPDDLLHEVLVRVLGGERQLPADVKTVPALAMIMKSIASAEFKARERHPVDSLTAPVDDESGHETDLADPGDSPEDLVARAETAKYDAILKLFVDHDAATYAIEALAAGFEPPEIQRDLDIDQTQWNSLRRLIRRRVNAAFPSETSP